MLNNRKNVVISVNDRIVKQTTTIGINSVNPLGQRLNQSTLAIGQRDVR